jgi:23S rRNA (uridine2552-2'-O)-methyltransferase
MLRSLRTIIASSKTRSSTNQPRRSGSSGSGGITRTGRRLGDRDKFFREAKAEGYVARSAFKLKEIQDKHKIIPPGGTVLDLGCHPGAWLQVACQSLGPKPKGGLVLGIDLQETEAPKQYCDDRVRIIQADATTLPLSFWDEHAPGGFHCVLSDMCHWTMGNSSDAFKSLQLARTAFIIAIGADSNSGDSGGVLKSGGNLVMKILQGEGTQEFAAELKVEFEKVAWVRPSATRKESKEVFLLGLKRRKKGIVDSC